MKIEAEVAGKNPMRDAGRQQPFTQRQNSRRLKEGEVLKGELDGSSP